MQVLFDFCVTFLDLIDGLYIFFFEPIANIPSALFARFETIDSTFLSWLVTNFLENLANRAPWFSHYSFATLFLGGGVCIFLLWRFLKFILPLLE